MDRIPDSSATLAHMGKRRYWQLILVGIAVLIVACSDAEAGTPTTAAQFSTTTAKKPTTTLAVPATTSTTAPSPPTTTVAAWSAEGMPSNEEVARALTELYSRYYASAQNPNEADVSSFCATNTKCHDEQTREMAILVERDRRYADLPPVEVTKIDAIVDVADVARNSAPPPDSRYAIHYTVKSEIAGSIVDADGNIVTEIFDSNPDLGRDDDIVRWPNDPELPWRFVD